MTNAATLVSTPGVSTPVVIHSIQVLSHSCSTARVSLTQPVWQGSVSTWTWILGLVCQILGLMLASHCWVTPPRRRGWAAWAAAPAPASVTQSGSVNWATPGPGSLHSKSKDWHCRRGRPGTGAAGPLTWTWTSDWQIAFLGPGGSIYLNPHVAARLTPDTVKLQVPGPAIN